MSKNILSFCVAGSLLAGCAPQITKLAANPATATLNKLDQNVSISVAATDAAGNVIAQPQFTWTSADPTVAAVDANGLITAKKSGTTTVTVQAGQVSAQVPVTVGIYSAIKINPDKLALNVGDKSALQAQIVDEKGSPLTGELAWSSENEKVVKVDAQGHVEAIGPGAAKLTVSAQDLKASVDVTIAAAAPAKAVKGKKGK